MYVLKTLTEPHPITYHTLTAFAMFRYSQDRSDRRGSYGPNNSYINDRQHAYMMELHLDAVHAQNYCVLTAEIRVKLSSRFRVVFDST